MCYIHTIGNQLTYLHRSWLILGYHGVVCIGGREQSYLDCNAALPSHFSKGNIIRIDSNGNISKTS